MNINPFLQSVVFVFETSEALTEQALCSRQIFQLVSIRSSKPEHKTALPSTPPALTRSPHSETTRQLDLNLEIIQPLWVQQIRCFAHGCCASKVNAQLHMSLGTWLSYGKKGWLCHVVNHMVDSLTDRLFVCLMHEDMDYVYYIDCLIRPQSTSNKHVFSMQMVRPAALGFIRERSTSDIITSTMCFGSKFVRKTRGLWVKYT